MLLGVQSRYVNGV